MSVPNQDKKNILVVDDDRTNRLILSALVTDAGYHAIEVSNGKEAVQQVELDYIDIILMDVMMPVMDGYQAARLIKSQHKRFIPIIFLTAMTDEESLVKCIDSGGDDFLTKPYNHVLLTSKINSMLRIANLYKSIEDQNTEIKEKNLHIQQEMIVTQNLFKKLCHNDLRGPDTGLNYCMSPMTMFNGDLIQAEENQTGGLDVIIADFTGHGLSAAIGALPVSDVFHTMTRKCYAFADILVEANEKLLDLLPTQMFMATALISIDRSNNVLSVVNAGLPDIYLYRKGQIIHTFKSNNIPLGITKMTSAQYEVDMHTLEYGDRIIAATDGIMEATNPKGEMLGLNRLLQVFEDTTQSEELFSSILNRCQQFCEGADQTDDITLLEICHVENMKLKKESMRNNEIIEPSDWSMQFSMDIKSLRQFDVLPYIMQAVNKLQPVESGRTSLHTVLTEMFANALDHGVLKLDSSMKSTPQGYMDFYQEKQKRLDQMQEGNIQVSLSHELNDKGGGTLNLHLMDSGEGYDYEHISEKKNNYSGRGLELISSLCTEMRILGKGNSVVAIYEWHKDDKV